MSVGRLSDEPTRVMTDRECVGMITGLVGVLLSKANLETVRRAVRYIAEHEDELFAIMGKLADGELMRQAERHVRD